MGEAFSGNLRIEILDWHDHALDTGGDQCIAARRSAAVVRVRFERDVCGAAAGFLARKVERDRFRVVDCFKEIVTFANDLARGTDDNAANEWSRTDLPHTFLRELQRAHHHVTIRVGPNSWRLSYSCRLHP